MFEKGVEAVEGVKISRVAGELGGEVVGLEIFLGVARAETGFGVGGM
jgi:hypothetical protein